MRILILNIGYFIKESLSTLTKSPLLNSASIVSIGLSLLILAVVFVGWWTSEEIITFIRQDAEMAVFYEGDLTGDQIEDLGDAILHLDGVVALAHVDEDEAYHRMESMMGEEVEVLARLGENPFDPFFSVNVDPGQIDPLSEELSRISGVDYVRDNEEIIKNLQSISNMIRSLGIVLAVIVGITTMIITSQIIRLGILTKEEQINMLKLLGASRGFVSIPFLLEGVILGGLGGAFASGLMFILLPFGQELVTGSLLFVPVPQALEILPAISIFLICLGVLFGFLGSLLSLRFTKEEVV